MRNALLIGIREFKATALTKAFIIGVVILPAAIWSILGVAGAMGLFTEKSEPLTGVVAIADDTPDARIAQTLKLQFDPNYIKQERERRLSAQRREIDEILGEGATSAVTGAMTGAAEDNANTETNTTDAPDEAESQPTDEQGSAGLMRSVAVGLLSQPDLHVTVSVVPSKDAEAQIERVRNGGLLAFVQTPSDVILPQGRYKIYVGDALKAKHIDVIESATRNAIQDVRFQTSGLNPSEIRRLQYRPFGDVKRAGETGETEANSEMMRLVPLIFVMLLFMSVFTGAQYLMMSTVEEKGSRVMEVLLSAASPMQLMLGKILGQGLVGLSIMLIYGGAGVLAATKYSQYIPHISTTVLVLEIIYFLLAYFMFAAIFASVGAAVTEIREAQALQGPIIGVVILVFYLSIFTGMANPHSMLNQVLSFIPPFSPMIMSMRVSVVADPAPMWQVVATIGVGVFYVIVMTWAAAKIFRVGVLMYGKPPSLTGLLKWIRYT